MIKMSPVRNLLNYLILEGGNVSLGIGYDRTNKFYQESFWTTFVVYQREGEW